MSIKRFGLCSSVMVALLVLALSAPLAAFAQNLLPDLLFPTYPNQTSCADQPSFYSCENTTEITNTCCSPYPGGSILATQFWDIQTGLEHEGQRLPKNSWTMHGLWPDFCNGFAISHLFIVSITKYST